MEALYTNRAYHPKRTLLKEGLKNVANVKKELCIRPHLDMAKHGTICYPSPGTCREGANVPKRGGRSSEEPTVPGQVLSLTPLPSNAHPAEW